MIGRRHFIMLLGGAAAVWPLAARAQQPAVPVVGLLNTRTAAATASQIGALRRGLSEAGFVEGRNLTIEYRWADDHIDRLPVLAADLVRRQVSVIVTENATTPAAKASTSTIPIVFISGANPIEAGLVTSLSRPGGNVTGVSFTSASLNPKRLELLHDLAPAPAIIASLWNPQARESDAELRDIEAAARALGRQALTLKPRPKVRSTPRSRRSSRLAPAHYLYLLMPFSTAAVANLSHSQRAMPYRQAIRCESTSWPAV